MKTLFLNRIPHKNKLTYVVFGGIMKEQTTENQYYAYKSKEDKGIMHGGSQ